MEADEDISLLGNNEKHCKDILGENIKEKRKFHELSQKVYMKDKEGFINREFPVEVPYPKWGNIVWTCVE